MVLTEDANNEVKPTMCQHGQFKMEVPSTDSPMRVFMDVVKKSEHVMKLYLTQIVKT